MNMTRRMTVCLIGLMIGCGPSEPSFHELHPGVAESELLPTLEELAKTGEHKEVLIDLMIGLEEGGYMQEAATISQCESLEDPAKVKALARQVAASVKRQQKNKERNTKMATPTN
ncbi:hypothetical protein M4951_00320 [Blastopirellula sp. J2-11]|uniref:hypothetical protein n=1 Tax=Blastopirellula sp. J2-11 TaxID=2943192 RepID=UPI0021C7A4F0|nr:hypothetical protein [Blastopirellula sp. J2-11]UUO06771.1 hypothetical protein M4951_00320 [Blastopirellula sp. J2-11]